MLLPRTTPRWLALFAFSALVSIGALNAVPTAGVQGAILDLAGAPVVGVRVLLGGSGGEVAAAVTEADGRFAFPPVDPGRYLLIASKLGFQTTLRRIDTLAAPGVELTLRLLGEEAPPGTNRPDPADSSWILRLPARDILRDLRPTVEVADLPADEAAPPASPAPASTGGARPQAHVDGEIQQWFSMALGAEPGETAPLEDGRSTEVYVAGRYGAALTWSIEGQTGREAATFGDGPLRGVADETHQLQMSVNVAADARNRLDLAAYFDQNDHRFNLQDAIPDTEPSAQRNRAWGYDAGWRGQVGGSSLDVHVDYGAADLTPAGVTGWEPLQDQRWGASGAIAFSPAERHRMRVGMRADVYQFESDELRLPLGPEWSAVTPVALGNRGWSANLFGRESYQLAGPVDLELGFDLHHVGFENSTSFLLPQAGVTYRLAPGQTLRALVMLKLDDRDPLPTEYGAAPEPETTEQRLGCLLSWSGQFEGRVRLEISGAMRPYAQERLVDEADFGSPVGGRHSLFISDGSASSREIAARIQKDVGRVRHSTGISLGRIEGSLLAYAPSSTVPQSLGLSEVEFVGAHVSTQVLPSGTQVRLEYQRVVSDHLPGALGDPADVTYSGLDLVVEQRVYSTPGRGDWRLLVGYEAILNSSGDASGDVALARLGVADDLRRVNGGVSISF
jgi:carboxypeptidase family protein